MPTFTVRGRIERAELERFELSPADELGPPCLKIPQVELEAAVG